MVEHQQDNIYITKVLEGDRNAFAYLVDKYKTMVYSLALRLVKDREEAEEISQDAFIKAYQSLASFKGKAKFSSWLYRIVYNTAISKLRQQPAGRVSLDEPNIPDTWKAKRIMTHFQQMSVKNIWKRHLIHWIVMKKCW